MEPFKNRYNKQSIQQMASVIKKHNAAFDTESFVAKASRGLGGLEMKERVVHIANTLETHLSGNFRQDAPLLLKTLQTKDKQDGLNDFILWPYTYYVETRGLQDFEVSMKALKEITKNFTSEWGVRPFFESHPDKVYAKFTKWRMDSNEHVRRWVSEGTRPNLPWGMKISHLDKNLKRNIELIEPLRHDPSEYVRRSVANHMNDITRLDAPLALETLKRWKKQPGDGLAWVVKHALRSLLKQGHAGALELLGFSPRVKMEVESLQLSKKVIREGDSFDLDFVLKNKTSRETDVMIDYIIHFPKANGQTSGKTFKLKTLRVQARTSSKIKKSVSFKKVTTRKHYPGKHRLEIMVNGKVRAATDFLLR